jgi:hypothetical protein
MLPRGLRCEHTELHQAQGRLAALRRSADATERVVTKDELAQIHAEVASINLEQNLDRSDCYPAPRER